LKIAIIEIISNLSDIEISEISNTSKFKDLGFDNLDMAELIMTIEDRFSIRAYDSMYYAETVGELIEQFEKLNITVK